MDFDPSTIAAIGDLGPNPARAKAQAFKLADLANMQQLNQIQLQRAKSEQADAAKAKEIFGQSDISTPEGATQAAEKLSKAGLVNHAMALQKASQERQTGDIELKVKKLQLASEQMEALGGAFDPVVAQLDQAKQAGASPAMLDAMAQKLITPVIQSLAQRPDLKQSISMFAQQPDALTYNGIKTAAQHTKVGSQAIKQRMEEYNSTTQRSKEEETERHNQAMESNANRKTNFQTWSFEDPKVNGVYAAMADKGISFPSGMRSVKAQRDTVQGLITAHPDDSPEQIAERIKRGRLSLAGSQTQLQTVARREGSAAAAINALNRDDGLYAQLLETGKNVDFGSAKFSNALSLWKQGAVVADPDISEYVNALADTRAEFASVLARGGHVTDSVRIAAEHAFPDKMSYEELQRNVERSKKIADSIQKGNSSVAEAIINGTSMEDALHTGNEAKASPAGGAPKTQAPEAAISHLKQHPELKDQFKAKYGYLPEGM